MCHAAGLGAEVVCLRVPAAIIIGMVKNALLPIYEEDRRKLREYCTKEGCGIGLKKDKQAGGRAAKSELKAPLMSPAEFNQKPVSFFTSTAGTTHQPRPSRSAGCAASRRSSPTCATRPALGSCCSGRGARC